MTDTPNRGRLKAAWTLIILAPICAELTFTAVALPETWLALPLLIPMYGAGVLLIREAVVRVGGGWPNLVVLGLAYELAEDGVGLQALTSTNMYDATDWGLRVLGLNTTYWESQIGIHVVFSVLLPVMLMDILFPRHRGRAYLRTGGLIGIGATAVVGVAGLRFGIAPEMDPGYQAPLPAVLGFVAAIAVLAVIALRILPGRRGSPSPLKSEPVVVALVTGVATPAFLAILMPVGLTPGAGPVFGDDVPLPIPMAAAALLAIGTGWLIRRWAADPDWSDRHRIWLAGGVLVGHTLFMMMGVSTVSLITGAVTIVIEVLALLLLARHVRRRSTIDATV
ncbi:MAG: hypothetical protein ACRD0P_07415 [Stackebrandtia sp.]